MNQIETSQVIQTIEELWPKTTDADMSVITRAFGKRSKVSVVNVLNLIAQDSEYHKAPRAKICKALTKMPNEAKAYTPVYALHPSGKHYSCNFIANDPEHARNLMKTELVAIIQLYSWETQVVDFTLYIGVENFPEFQKARKKANHGKDATPAMIAKQATISPPSKYQMDAELKRQKEALALAEATPYDRAKLESFGYGKTKP